MSENFLSYFPSLTEDQKIKLTRLRDIYGDWNSKINVISRKDMDNFFIHHVLHSLAVSKIISFKPGTSILDVGTGGGFPGIPLSIIFPDSEFTLLDSIEKKIKVVREVVSALDLKNVKPLRKRMEEEKDTYEFIISRAVTSFPEFVKLTGKNISGHGKNDIKNGIIYLKGGDISEELMRFRNRVRVWKISDFFGESFFETKLIVYLPV